MNNTLRTGLTQCFWRELHKDQEPGGELVLVRAAAPARILSCDKTGDRWLVQAQVTSEPGDVAFAWMARSSLAYEGGDRDGTD